MKELQVFPEQFPDINILKNWEHNGRKIILITDWRFVNPEIPIYCFSDLTHEYVRRWLNTNQPAIYGGRGYVGNHLYKQRLFSRVSVNGWANISLNSFPHSRWRVMNLPKHPWKVRNVKRVLIAPSKATSTYWTPNLENGWVASMMDKFPGAEIKVRFKTGKPGVRWSTLWNDFDWADLVVSQSSAVTVEAFWYGKKVISTEPCITWAAHKSTLDNWEDPTEPLLRDQWHEHLAWSQFTNAEFSSGEFLNLLEQYVGPITSYNPQHHYNLKI